MPKRDPTLELLNGLRHADDAVVTKALGHKANFVVAKAAGIVAERELSAESALVAALENWLDRPPGEDKGCEAKHALVEALNRLGTTATDVLHRAARCVQLEPVGLVFDPSIPDMVTEPIDAAANMRGVAVLALAAAGDADVLPLMVDYLFDRPKFPQIDVPGVRISSARGLGLTGQDSAALVLRAKLKADTDVEEVIAESATALCMLRPRWLETFVRPWIAEQPSETLQLTGLAVAELRPPNAFEVLGWLWERLRHERGGAELLTAFALLRSEPATDFLLGLIREGEFRSEAKAALTPWMEIGDLRERVREAERG
ncbi:MAG: hypothetical protein AAGD32_08790 [Planctomycetota bacterium]